ncbi:MAG: DUF177 domain-containing protein [Bacteroidetes bacterium]|nr:DUF177 domain-containing protein [Bacteroidota bacterium]
MKKLSNPYLIPFAGLKSGEHNFDYVIDDTFFKEREYSEVQHAKIKTSITLSKEINLLVFDIKMEGTINVMCDRCGDYFDLPVWGENKLVVSLTNDKFENEADILAIPIDSSEIDISQYLYEYVSMLLPQRRIHTDKSGCNPEALKILNKLSEKKGEENIDPRWEALKNIKQN